MLEYNPLAKRHFTYLLATARTKMRRRERMKNESVMSNIMSWHIYTSHFFPWQVVWAQSPKLIINVWLLYSQQRFNNLTIKLFVDFTTV